MTVLTLSIAVVIPVHNRRELTENCLRHPRTQKVSHSVVVCDNGSTDGTADRVRTEFPDARVRELGANTGFSAVCNRGVEAGTGDVVVLLNNDVECPAAFLERLVAPLTEGESVGSASPLPIRPGEERIDSVGLTVDVTLAGYPRLRGRPIADAQATTPVLVGPTGAA